MWKRIKDKVKKKREKVKENDSMWERRGWKYWKRNEKGRSINNSTVNLKILTFLTVNIQ